MTCPGCGQENPTVARFCGACGAALRAAATGPFASPRVYTPTHLAEKILTSAGALEGERNTTHCYAALAQLALLRGDPDRARRLADQSLETGTPTASRKFESWAWRLKGESALVRRAWDEADAALRRALTIAEGIRHPRQTWLSYLALGRLRAAQGRRDEARLSYRMAQAIVAGLRERTQDPGLRTGLTAAPVIRELEELART